ncbi:MAG: hypothetical protein WC356_02050 [Candidatus Micrarchaeia archaeon]|jgi:hypothetical protein
MKNISEIAKMKTQSFDVDGNLVITADVLDFLKKQEVKIKELTTENVKLKNLLKELAEEGFMETMDSWQDRISIIIKGA